MKIQNVETVSEATKKFVMAEAISKQEKLYADSTEALPAPVAAKIFGFPWTESVTVGQNFVSITKQDWVEWSVLEEPLKGLIEEHFSDQTGAVEENPEAPQAKSNNLDSTEAQAISKLIEEQINPALSAHGGFVVLH